MADGVRAPVSEVPVGSDGREPHCLRHGHFVQCALPIPRPLLLLHVMPVLTLANTHTCYCQWCSYCECQDGCSHSLKSVTGTGETWRSWKLYVLLVGAYSGTSALEKSWAGPQKVQQRVTAGLCHPTPRNSCPHRKLHTNVHSSIIHHSQKAETAQMSIDGRKDKESVAFTQWCHPVMTRDGVPTHATTRPLKALSERRKQTQGSTAV